MLFLKDSTSPLAKELTGLRLRLAAGAVPALSVDLLAADEARVRAQLGPDAVFCLGVGGKRLPFSPLAVGPPERGGCVLQGLVASSGLLRWFARPAGGATPPPLLVYQRGPK